MPYILMVVGLLIVFLGVALIAINGKKMPDLTGAQWLYDLTKQCDENLGIIRRQWLDKDGQPGWIEFFLLDIPQLGKDGDPREKPPFLIMEFNPDASVAALYLDKDRNGYWDERLSDGQARARWANGACDAVREVTGG